MAVTVLSQARRPGLRAAGVRADARSLLDALDAVDSELNVVLVDDTAIRELNRSYRRRDRPTDVLAFAVHEGPRAPGDEKILGDVVISVDTAARQARERRRTLREEVRTLLIHGLLHLLGYDHERSSADARRMRAVERRLAQILEATASREARRCR